MDVPTYSPPIPCRAAEARRVPAAACRLFTNAGSVLLAGEHR